MVYIGFTAAEWAVYITGFITIFNEVEVVIMNNELNVQSKVARLDKTIIGGCACVTDPEPCASSGGFYTGLRYNVAQVRSVAGHVTDMPKTALDV